MGSRQEENSGTRDVSTEHQIDIGKLEDYLQEHVDGYAGPLTIKQAASLIDILQSLK